MKYRISPTYSEAIYKLKVKEINRLANDETPGIDNYSKAIKLMMALERKDTYFYTMRSVGGGEWKLTKHYWSK